MNEWINVEDRLPKEEILFLSFSDIYGYQLGMYSSNPDNSNQLPMAEALKITHWMPLPAAPKQ